MSSSGHFVGRRGIHSILGATEIRTDVPPPARSRTRVTPPSQRACRSRPARPSPPCPSPIPPGPLRASPSRASAPDACARAMPRPSSRTRSDHPVANRGADDRQGSASGMACRVGHRLADHAEDDLLDPRFKARQASLHRAGHARLQEQVTVAIADRLVESQLEARRDQLAEDRAQLGDRGSQMPLGKIEVSCGVGSSLGAFVIACPTGPRSPVASLSGRRIQVATALTSDWAAVVSWI